jgi:hypothetical protein
MQPLPLASAGTVTGNNPETLIIENWKVLRSKTLKDCISRNLEPGALSRYSDGLQVRWPGLDSRRGQGIIFQSTASRRALGFHVASYPMGTYLLTELSPS